MLVRCALVILFSLAVTHSAYADSIPVTAGSFSESTSTVADFTISGSTFSISGIGTSVVDVLQQCIVCTPGTDFSMSGSWDFEGVEDSGGMNVPVTGHLSFTSSLVSVPSLAENNGAESPHFDSSARKAKACSRR